MGNLRPFLARINEPILADLKARLLKTRFPDEISNSKWNYGTNLTFLKSLAHYWINEFDWRVQEKKLNQFPQFLVTIDGLDIHFIHVKGTGPNPLPLILTHGWPSSIFELLKVIPLLTNPEDPRDSFDVVVPSLPGFGFSSRPSGAGMSIFKVADIWNKLATDELHYPKYGAQGGDWGAYATSYLGFKYAKSLYGIHLSFVPGGLAPYLGEGAKALSDSETDLINSRRNWDRFEGGYEHLQGTKPQTIAYALNDSPLGLAAWISEKFRTWSDCGGDLETRFSMDELLAHITLYWATETIGSSARLYYETHNNPWKLEKNQRVEVPTAIAVFPRELSVPPREWAERIYNVQQWTPMPKGGHFAAHEEPIALVSDIRKFFRNLR